MLQMKFYSAQEI